MPLFGSPLLFDFDAQGLLVPISFRQLARLRAEGRVRRMEHGFLVADVEYDEKLGLILGTSSPTGE